MKVYKYRPIDDYTKDSLLKNYLFFSKPSSLNDPFECTFKLDMHGTTDEIKIFVKEVLERDPSFISLTRDKRRQIINDKTNNIKKGNINIDEIMANIKTSMDKNSICSLSKINDDILMWSHYAGGHKGLCLEFDYEDLRKLVYQGCTIDTVRYKNALPIINRVKNRDHMELYPIFKTKSEHWEYENEVRIINSKGNDKVYFEKEWLKGIIFGQGTSKKMEDEISKLVIKTGYNVQFYKATKDDSSYSLKVINYEKLVLDEKTSQHFFL